VVDYFQFSLASILCCCTSSIHYRWVHSEEVGVNWKGLETEYNIVCSHSQNKVMHISIVGTHWIPKKVFPFKWLGKWCPLEGAKNIRLFSRKAIKWCNCMFDFFAFELLTPKITKVFWFQGRTLVLSEKCHWDVVPMETCVYTIKRISGSCRFSS
jgi:hypothetical protein